MSVSLPILSVPGMGKHAPVRINLQNRACFKGHVSGHPETPSESVNVGCCRLCKSVGDTRNIGDDLYSKAEIDYF